MIIAPDCLNTSADGWMVWVPASLARPESRETRPLINLNRPGNLDSMNRSRSDRAAEEALELQRLLPDAAGSPRS